MSATSTSAEPLNADNLAKLSRGSSTDHLDWVIEQCRTTYPIEKLPAATDDGPGPSTKQPSAKQNDAGRPSPWRRRDGGDKGNPLLSYDPPGTSSYARKLTVDAKKRKTDSCFHVVANENEASRSESSPIPPANGQGQSELNEAAANLSAKKQKVSASHLDAARNALRERQANHCSTKVTKGRVTQPSLAASRVGFLNKGAASKPLAVGNGVASSSAFSDQRFLGQEEALEHHGPAQENEQQQHIQPAEQRKPARTTSPSPSPSRPRTRQQARLEQVAASSQGEQDRPITSGSQTNSDAEHSAYSLLLRKKARKEQQGRLLDDSKRRPSRPTSPSRNDTPETGSPFLADMADVVGESVQINSRPASPILSAWRGSAWRATNELHCSHDAISAERNHVVLDQSHTSRSMLAQGKAGLIYGQSFEALEVALLYRSPSGTQPEQKDGQEHHLNSPFRDMTESQRREEMMDMTSGDIGQRHDGHTEYELTLHTGRDENQNPHYERHRLDYSRPGSAAASNQRSDRPPISGPSVQDLLNRYHERYGACHDETYDYDHSFASIEQVADDSGHGTTRLDDLADVCEQQEQPAHHPYLSHQDSAYGQLGQRGDWSVNMNLKEGDTQSINQFSLDAQGQQVEQQQQQQQQQRHPQSRQLYGRRDQQLQTHLPSQPYSRPLLPSIQSYECAAASAKEASSSSAPAPRPYLPSLQQALRGAVGEVERARYSWQFDDHPAGEAGIDNDRRQLGASPRPGPRGIEDGGGFWGPQALGRR